MHRLIKAALPTILLLACAPTLKVKSHPASINLCPYFPQGEDSSLIGAYEAELTLKKKSDPDFIKSVTCDSTSYPKLQLCYSRTAIVGQPERTKAMAITAAGVATPAIMIASGMPFFIFFWSIPTNRLEMKADLADSLEVDGKGVQLFVNTTGWTGSRESQFERQAAESGRVIDGILKQIKTPRK
jgi:hypothetical protein